MERRSLLTAVPALLAAGAIGSVVPSGVQRAHAAPSAGTVTFQVASHNTKRGAAAFSAFAPIIGWQEVEKKADREKLRQRRPGYAHFVAPSPGAPAIPISWKKSEFTKLKQGHRRTHDGTAGETPHRYIAWVLLEHKSKARLIFVNTHFINGAWNGAHPDHRGRWEIHRRKLVELLGDLDKNFPKVPKVLVGDFNKKSPLSLPGMTYLPRANAKGVGYDHIYVSNGTAHGKSVLLGRDGSDHNAIRAQVTLNT